MDWMLPAATSVLSAVPTLARGAAAALVVIATHGLTLAVILSRYLGVAAAALARFALLPVSLAWGVAFLVLSPVIYTVAYALAPFWFFVNLVPKLQPLYIYFGSAAFVGIVAGAFVKFAADLSASMLLLDKEDQPITPGATTPQLLRRESADSTTPSSAKPAPPSAVAKREDDYFGFGLPEIDWQVIDRMESRGPHSEQMRRMPLLQSIILEEDSSGAGE